MDSILISIKKLLGIEADYTHFDPDIIMHINSALFLVNQLGIGPSTGFSITGNNETWGSLLGTRTDLDVIKSYVYINVRLLFDPPSSSFVIDAMERQIRQMEWRLYIQAEPVTQEVIVSG